MNIQLPESLFKSIYQIQNLDVEKFKAAHQLPAVSSIRLNPLKQSNAYMHDRKVPWCDTGRYLNERPNFTADPLLHAGCYYVQEASSMFLAHALLQVIDFDKSMVALDLCAAPGGKSTLLSSLMNDDSLLIANEVITSRATILAENLCKWGKINTWVSCNDPKDFSRIKEVFDLVLIDAPCSGSGLFRKKPEFVNEWNTETVNLCTQRQQRITHDIFETLKDQGVLIYMTCSYCMQENEEMVDYIMQEFDVESIQINIDKTWQVVETVSEKHQGYGYRFYPHLVEGEGFFLAVFRRKSADGHEMSFEQSLIRKKEHSIAALAPYVNCTDKSSILHNDLLLLIEYSHEPYLKYFSQHVRLIKKGILCGKMIRAELIPDHELAMFASVEKHVPSVEVPYTVAIKYLQKENFELACPSKGWYIVRYNGHNLGWIKNIGNRINNYYPSNYRILNKNILSAK